MKRASKKSARVNLSAGLLMFRRGVNGVEVLIAHPGGPFWAKRDAGAWSIPKGLLNADEEPLAAACREFEEETGVHPKGPFLELGEVRQKAGKVIQAWACEGNVAANALKSNEVRLEWPSASGRWITFPEVDRYLWCDPQTAREKLNLAQAEFVDRLEILLSDTEKPSVR